MGVFHKKASRLKPGHFEAVTIFVSFNQNELYNNIFFFRAPLLLGKGRVPQKVE
jgi:hypothetical protein